MVYWNNTRHRFFWCFVIRTWLSFVIENIFRLLFNVLTCRVGRGLIHQENCSTILLWTEFTFSGTTFTLKPQSWLELLFVKTLFFNSPLSRAHFQENNSHLVIGLARVRLSMPLLHFRHVNNCTHLHDHRSCTQTLIIGPNSLSARTRYRL